MKAELLLCGAAAIAMDAAGQTSRVSIELVRITLTADRQVEQMAGSLFRLKGGRSEREWVADVDRDGRPSRSIRCNHEDAFEVEIKRSLAFPDDPVRVQCSRQLAFSFTRPKFATKDLENSFLAASSDKIDVVGLSQLAGLARTSGDLTLARAAVETATSSTAMWLGDANLSKFVVREPTLGYQLVLNAAGLAALKAKQSSLKLPQTGTLDVATQMAMRDTIFKGSYQGAGITYCGTSTTSLIACTSSPADPSLPLSEPKVRILFKK